MLFRSELTGAQMREYMKKRPDEAYAEYDSRGRIRDFFVLWREIPAFGEASRISRETKEDDTRVYVLDRAAHMLRFGSGRRRIPRNTESVAFRVELRLSDGSAGNLPAETITTFRHGVLSVAGISQPLPSYGGSSVESEEQAIRRASGALSSGGRLVSKSDYENEALYFSDNIDQVSCTIEEDTIVLTLLMKDYKNGSYSFRKLHDAMRGEFLSRSALSVGEKRLLIREPLFIEICFEVWLKAEEKGREYDLERYWRERIEDFLNPLSGDGHTGRRIGTLPQKAEIDMLFHDATRYSEVENYQISAYFKDAQGAHECELSKLYGNPYCLAVNGRHILHMRWTR